MRGQLSLHSRIQILRTITQWMPWDNLFEKLQNVNQIFFALFGDAIPLIMFTKHE